jgi:hypothetical protein
LVEQWRKMYSSSEWVSGQTTATILATIGGALALVCTTPGFLLPGQRVTSWLFVRVNLAGSGSGGSRQQALMDTAAACIIVIIDKPFCCVFKPNVAAGGAGGAAPADYFSDITTFVEPGFSRRTCEGVLEELVRRSSSYALAAMDRGLAAAATAMGIAAQGGVDPSDLVLTRMAQDERDVQVSSRHPLCWLAVVPCVCQRQQAKGHGRVGCAGGR